MRKFTEAFVAWCADDSAAARFERTVVQGVLAAVAMGVTTGEWGASFGTAVIVAVLSPVQAALGGAGKGEEHHA